MSHQIIDMGLKVRRFSLVKLKPGKFLGAAVTSPYVGYQYAVWDSDWFECYMEDWMGENY
jgi:hypothetical protein